MEQPNRGTGATMKKTIRAVAVLSLIAAAAYAGNVEQNVQIDRSSAAGRLAHESVAALHAAIPANAASGDVFEYSSPVTMPAKKLSFAGDLDGNVFEYN